MSNLQHRQETIQAKRKQTSFRDFLMEIASWMPVMFYKINWKISRFPQTWREWELISVAWYPMHETISLEWRFDFMNTYKKFFLNSQKMIVQQWFENENSDFAECYGAKNCYLSFGVWQEAENILYSMMSHTNLYSVFNSFSVVWDCSNIYSSRCVTKGYNIFFSSNIHNARDVWFSANLVWCTECILCYDLENKSFCIENKQYEKDVYILMKQKILSNTWMYQKLYEDVLEIPIDNKHSTDVTWCGIIWSRSLFNAYFAQYVIEWRNIFLWGGKYWWKYFYDCFDAGNQEDEHLYAVNYVWETSSHVYCTIWGAHLHNVYYSYHMEWCSYCLWCIGLKNKSFCIFNKQYTKEERHQKVDEIFTKMEQEWILGDFFPWSMNPFYFNDTAAYLIDDSFTKEEVEAKGYLRRDEVVKVDIPEWVEVVKTSELDEYEWWRVGGWFITSKWSNIRSNNSPRPAGTPLFEGGDEPTEAERRIDPSILKKVIQDDQWNVYKIVKMEYDFLMKYGLPLPRLHRLERMKMNFKIV